MKKFLISAAAVAMMFASCSKDKEIEYITVHDTVTVNKEVEKVVEKEKLIGYYTENTPLIIEKGDTVIVNYGNIEVGKQDGQDIVYEMYSTIMDPKKGKYTEYTLNCNALGALALKDAEGGLKGQDMENPVTHVTIVNRGTITVHTKDLVEKYRNQIQTPDNQGLKYKYFRVIVMFAGKNSKVVNEGKINVYFDHDPEILSTVYVMGLVAGDGGEIVNSGEINFYGTGSKYTRMRGAATFANSITIINDGKISAKVDVAEDSRGITTGGTNTNVVNNGTIEMTLPGTLFGMTRYANNNLVNNGTIKLTSVACPEQYRLTDFKICSAFYDPHNDKRTGLLSPMLNRGTVTVDMQGAEEAQNRVGIGMMIDVLANSTQKYIDENLNVYIENEGAIKVSSVSPSIPVAEAGFKSSAAGVGAAVTLGQWKTTLRDFAQTKDLFLSLGLKMNVNVGKLILSAPDNYTSGTAYSIAQNAIISARNPNQVTEITGYDNMTVASGSADYELVWDKENQTAALKKSEVAAK